MQFVQNGVNRKRCGELHRRCIQRPRPYRKRNLRRSSRVGVLLKADQAEGGPGWLDAEIVEALDTNLTMVSSVREKLVTEGLDAVLPRKKRETPPIPPIPAFAHRR